MNAINSEKSLADGLDCLLKTDPRLVPVALCTGKLPLRLQPSGFPGLTKIIIGQQISRASAQAIHKRFVNLINPQTPQQFLDSGEEVWHKTGLSRPKQATLTALAHAIECGQLPIDDLNSMPAAQAITQLTQIRGIGIWTAEVYLLFCTGHPDIFPAGDLALQHAVGEILNGGVRTTERQLRELAQCWIPYRGLAARLFWAYYGVSEKRRGALPARGL